jgi:hypothetical protein
MEINIMKIRYAFLLTFSVLFLNSLAYCQYPIGYLINDNNYKFTIIRNNAEAEVKLNPIKLFPNDTIKSKDVKKITINWAPYYGKLVNDSEIAAVRVEQTESKIWTKLSNAIANYLGFIKEDVLLKSAVQRGISLNELPDSSIIAVGFLPIKFTCSNGKSLSIFGGDHKELFTKDIKGKNSIDIIPRKLKLKPDGIYYWKITDSNGDREGKIKLLNAEIQEKMYSDFNTINKLSGNKSERNIKKALYLQMLSDYYYNDPDLYWLSYQMLENINQTEYPDVKFIITRYNQHSDSMESE